MILDNYDQYFRVCVQCGQRKHISAFKKWKKHVQDHRPCHSYEYKNYQKNPKNNLLMAVRNYDYNPVRYKK